MADRPNLLPDPFGAGRYEIRLAGHLDARWVTWFDGLTVSHAADGTTRIAGPVTDQAALHGLLQKLRDLGITLLSLTRLTPGPVGEQPATPHDQTRHNPPGAPS